jgi:hypothetical protein
VWRRNKHVARLVRLHNDRGQVYGSCTEYLQAGRRLGRVLINAGIAPNAHSWGEPDTPEWRNDLN